MVCVPVECAGSSDSDPGLVKQGALHAAVPHSHCNHPMPTNVVEYCLEKLWLRSYDHFMAQVKAVESVPTEVQREELAHGAFDTCTHCITQNQCCAGQGISG